MANLIFYIVDVFAETKYSGNQLAVIRGAKSLVEHEMQAIAKEMNYSETTFILEDQEVNGGYDVRIFTPEEELPFAGHPTLGTAFIIQKEIIRQPVETIILNLKVGQIPVTFEETENNSMLWMKQKAPSFGEVYEKERIAKILQIDVEEIHDQYPIQEVSTGIGAIIVPLRNLEAVKKSRIDKELYFDFVKNIESKAILVFAPEAYEQAHDVNARVFVDYFGIPEDPATGSANGCLASYLLHHQYFGQEKIDIVVEQGYEMKRPSLLYLKADQPLDSEMNVHVGGKVVFIARGELF